MAQWVDGALAFADFEMKLWAGHIAGGTNFCNHLAFSNFITTFDQQCIIMSVSCHPAA